VSGLRRVAGERTVVLAAGAVELALRLSASPALTVAAGGEPLATIGEGAPAWPVPADAPAREWDRVDAAALEEASAAARRAGSSAVRAVLDACPGLGRELARLVGQGEGQAFAGLRERLRQPHPVLMARGAPDTCDDALLVAADALVLAPVAIEEPGRQAWPQPSWTAAAALFLRARLRGRRFARDQREALAAAGREVRRLDRLLTHLEGDLRGLPAAAELRRQAEALLAAPGSHAAGADEVDVPDPYDPASRLRVRVDPGLGLPANADRLFARARRLERAFAQVEARIADTREALARARAREAAPRAARNHSDLAISAGGDAPPAPAGAAASPGPAGVRHFLTSRGLSVLVGRGARENHRLTFAVAGPEDVWLHARDVPGAHVILRDPEGRAAADDLREAAELAAFFSDAGQEAQVDVHVTRRKHVRPARGGPGRVIVGHSDTLRVAPRAPEGRLRRR
jgi:fibronectin-binding protein A (FbpA)/ribosomal quality control pathway NFACT family protein